MNERIENLMYEAGLLADGCWEEMDEYDQKAIERFAELIVRECAAYAFSDDQDHKAMLNYFGVKE